MSGVAVLVAATLLVAATSTAAGPAAWSPPAAYAATLTRQDLKDITEIVTAASEERISLALDEQADKISMSLDQQADKISMSLDQQANKVSLAYVASTAITVRNNISLIISVNDSMERFLSTMTTSQHNTKKKTKNEACQNDESKRHNYRRR